jgi:Kdo2-lipid IVA lauroyltransferase/acyltransferase
MTMLDRLLLHLLRLLAMLLGLLPAFTRDALAVALGRVFYGLDRHHRRVALDNLARAFGNEKSADERRAIARRTCENICRMVFEICWALRLKDQALSSHFTLSGLHHYRRALAQGKGAILFTGHFGNWELMPIVCHMVRISVTVVYRPLDAAFIDQFIKESRSRFGAVPIPTRTGAMRRLYVALRRGHTVGMLVDQNEGWRQGVYADLFGQRACSNPGIAILALKSGAPIVPFFMIRQGDRFHAELGPPLPLVRSGDATKDVETIVQQCNNALEAHIRRYPDQWFWVHQRWKTPSQCVWPDPERRDRWEKSRNRRGR